MNWMYIVLSCIISVVLAQNEDSPFDTSMTLPPELQSKFNESEIENAKNKYLEQFKKKCEKNGHPEVFDDAQNAVQALMSCTQSLVDMNTLQEEIEEAKPNGKVDEVFKKYCTKTPQFKKCFRNMTETVKPCFAPAEQKNFKTLYNVTDQLAEFICYKDGDRIALFIAEGGKECFQEKQEQIQNCFNQTFDSQTQSNLQNISFDGILDLEFKEKQCNQMTQLQLCIVGSLESCTKPTSANIMDSLFNFIRKATPCKNFVKAGVDTKTKKGDTAEKSSSPGAASGLAIASGTVFMGLIAAILV